MHPLYSGQQFGNMNFPHIFNNNGHFKVKNTQKKFAICYVRHTALVGCLGVMAGLAQSILGMNEAIFNSIFLTCRIFYILG